MKIDRENCEAWFLDYYEGNLSKESVEELRAFLVLNPDLREVFDSYADVSFSPDNKINFEGKADLKKTVAISDGIDETNYEEYFVGEVENVLNDGEKKELEEFLAKHPAKRNELDLLRKTILEPEGEIVFENKSALKKSVHIDENNFAEYAVAAIEGELSAEVMIQFHAFLASHPELKKEFGLFSRTKLQAETEIVFEGKDALKKKQLSVTAENFEQLAISHLEGLLNAEEEKVFAAALAANAEWKKSFALYKQTRVQADTSIVFEDKASLKRKGNDRGFFWWTPNIRFAAAAAIALLIGIVWWGLSGNNPVAPSNGNPVANKDASNKNSNPIVLPNGDSANQDSLKNNLASSNRHKNSIIPISIHSQKDNALAQNNRHKNSIIPISIHSQKDNVLAQNNRHKNSLIPISIHPKNGTAIADDPSSFTAIAFNGKTKSLNTTNEQQVDFSGAYYNAVQVTGVAEKQSESDGITPGQFAMRWMKNKLDHSANVNGDQDDAVYTAVAQNKNSSKDVTGFDLTSSAVNALGQATGSNLHLAHENDRTILTVGKYKVLLNKNN